MGTGPGICQRRRGDGGRRGPRWVTWRAADAERRWRRRRQAECLRGLERAEAVLTAARASILAAFTAGQGLLAGRGLQRACPG